MDKLRIKMQKGSVMVLFAVLLPIFVFFVSVVVDFARAHAHKAYLQNVADAAALAGVKTVVPTETARLVPDYPGDENDANLADDSTNAKANSAADKSVESNGDSANPFTSVDKKLKKNGESYYYKVKIIEHVPLLVARAFLPNSVMPDGFPVEVVAWASIDNPSAEENLFKQLDKIGNEQLVKDYKTIKAAIGTGAARNRVENVGRNDKSLGLPTNIYFSESDGKIVRTETVAANEVGNISQGREGTWKYLLVEFQPDIAIKRENGILRDGTFYFPFDTWDVAEDRPWLGENDEEPFTLTPEQWKIVTYANMANVGGGRRENVIKNLMNQFELTKDEAEKVLETAITNVVSFSKVNKVRGGIEKVEEDKFEERRSLLEAWEQKKKKSGGAANTEAAIATYTGNTALADLVVRSTKIKRILDDGTVEYYVSAYDPLLVKIESEDMNKTPSETNTDTFFASSVRNFTFKIDADNTGIMYRPLIIYYYGPEDFDGNTGSSLRKSRLVTLELNADFKGILFAPNSPVVIKPNGHKIRGVIIAESYRISKETPIDGNFASAFGMSSSDLIFDDFDMFSIDPNKRISSNVILTSQQAQHLN